MTRKICNSLFDFAGKLQHAVHKDRKLHPSRQFLFRDEARCVFNLVEEICYTRAMQRLKAVPITEPEKALAADVLT